jgi:hypothetical protein
VEREGTASPYSAVVGIGSGKDPERAIKVPEEQE